MDGMTGAVSNSYDDYQSVAFSKPSSPHACVQCDQMAMGQLKFNFERFKSSVQWKSTRLVTRKPHTFDQFKFSRFFSVVVARSFLNSVPLFGFRSKFMAVWPLTSSLSVERDFKFVQ